MIRLPSLRFREIFFNWFSLPRRNRVSVRNQDLYDRKLRERVPFIDKGTPSNSLSFKEQIQKYYYNFRPKPERPSAMAALSGNSSVPDPDNDYLMSNTSDFYRVVEALWKKNRFGDCFVHEIIEIVNSSSNLSDIRNKYSDAQLVSVPLNFLKVKLDQNSVKKTFSFKYRNSEEHAKSLAALGYTLDNADILMKRVFQSRVDYPIVSLRIRPLVGITITHAAFVQQNHAESSEPMGIFTIAVALPFGGRPRNNFFDSAEYTEKHPLRVDNNFVVTGYLRNGRLDQNYKKALLKIFDLVGQVGGFLSKRSLTKFMKKKFSFSNPNPRPIQKWDDITFAQIASFLTKINDNMIDGIISDEVNELTEVEN